MNSAHSNRTARKPLAVGVAAVLALGGAFALGATSPAGAAPLSINQLALKEAAPSDVIDVRRRWRRHRHHRHYGGHAVAGLALGIIGAAIAAHHYDRFHRRHYYHPYGYYGRPDCIRRHGAVYCRY